MTRVSSAVLGVCVCAIEERAWVHCVRSLLRRRDALRSCTWLDSQWECVVCDIWYHMACVVSCCMLWNQVFKKDFFLFCCNLEPTGGSRNVTSVNSHFFIEFIFFYGTQCVVGWLVLNYAAPIWTPSGRRNADQEAKKLSVTEHNIRGSWKWSIWRHIVVIPNSYKKRNHYPKHIREEVPDFAASPQQYVYHRSARCFEPSTSEKLHSQS